MPDLAVGAKGDDDGGSDSGAVYILFMNSDGSVESSQKLSNSYGDLPFSTAESSYFGCAIGVFDDLNG